MSRWSGFKEMLSLMLLVGLTGGSDASVQLRFDPPNQVVPLNGNGTLYIMLDDTLDVRTIETWAEFDPDILLSLSGGPGSLITGTGCPLFNDFDDDIPGEWYGGSVILGYDCWATGPGQLYRWDFQGIAEGMSQVTAVQVRLYDPDAHIIADVVLPPTDVFVGVGTAAPDPAAAAVPVFKVRPNPFNPRVRIELGGMSQGTAFIEAYDTAGRRLARIWEGELDGSAHSVSWEARDEAGRSLPSGVYLFRLTCADGRTVSRRAVLLK